MLISLFVQHKNGSEFNLLEQLYASVMKKKINYYKDFFFRSQKAVGISGQCLVAYSSGMSSHGYLQCWHTLGQSNVFFLSFHGTQT